MASRIIGLDVFRLLAAISVISLHVGYYDALPEVVGIELRLVARWAVPFFFMVSGYFASDHLMKNPNRIITQVGRVYFILLVSSFFLIPLSIYRNGFVAAFNSIFSVDILTTGSFSHLWFLSSLGGLLAYYFFQTLNLRKIASLCILLSLGICLFNAYFPKQNPCHSFARYLMCFPFLFLGGLIRQKKLSLSPMSSISLILFSVLLLSFKTFVLWKYLDKSPYAHDFLIGTIPFTVGMVFFAMTIPPLLYMEFISKVGATYSLGIYIFHEYSISLVDRMWVGNAVWKCILIVPLAFIISLVLLSVAFRVAPSIKRIIAGYFSELHRLNALIPLPPAFPEPTQKDPS